MQDWGSQNQDDSKKKDVKKVYNPFLPHLFQQEDKYYSNRKEFPHTEGMKGLFDVQNQVDIDEKSIMETPGAKLLTQSQQKISPFSNAIIFRMFIPSYVHPQGKQSLGLGSGTIVKIQGKKYMATVFHNFYLQQTWFMPSSAYLKIQSSLNSIRKKMEIKKQMISQNKQYLKTKKHQDEPIFIEIEPSFQNLIKGNDGLQIIFDWNQIDSQKVYLMGFPFKQNSKKFDMKDMDNSINLNLCFRELKTLSLIKNNKILRYRTTTQKGESGGALVIYKQTQSKFYLIGMHLGGDQKNKQYNIGVLFTSDLKEKFPHIFLNKEKPINQEEQNQQKVAIDFFQYLIKLYNGRNDRGNQTGDAKDWSDFWGRVLKQYLTKLKPLEKNQKCKGTLHRIFSNIKQRKSRYDQLMNVPKRNFQFSESTIAKQLRVHVLPAAQALVKILQGDKKIISVKDLQQYHQPYAWQYFPGGRRQPYQ